MVSAWLGGMFLEACQAAGPPRGRDRVKIQSGISTWATGLSLPHSLVSVIK